MKLSDLLAFNEIVIQCHDNPDADAIASGFALYKYFTSKGKNVRQIYSGNFKISKRNLKFMVEKLEIPIEYVPQLEIVPELLITCDCQYGEGNVYWMLDPEGNRLLSTGILPHLAIRDGMLQFTPNGSETPGVSRSLIYEKRGKS